jgi:hypothetical protein
VESVLGKHIEDWLSLISSTKNDRKVSTITQVLINAELMIPKTSKKSKKALNKQDLVKIFGRAKKVHSSPVVLYIYRTKLIMKKIENISVLQTNFNISDLTWDKDSVDTQILFSLQETANKSQQNALNKLPFDFSLKFENTEKKKNFLMKLHLSKDEHNKVIKSRDNDIKFILSQPLPTQKNDIENVDIYSKNEELNIGNHFKSKKFFFFYHFIFFLSFYFLRVCICYFEKNFVK